jgi:hypothetical protein
MLGAANDLRSELLVRATRRLWLAVLAHVDQADVPS